MRGKTLHARTKRLVGVSSATLVLLAGSAGAGHATSGDQADAPTTVEPSLAEIEASDYAEAHAPLVVAEAADAPDVPGATTSGTTWTLRSSNTWKSLVGLTVITHTGITSWTGSGGNLWSSPRSLTYESQTVPPTFLEGGSVGNTWDWYNPGWGGTARANHGATYVTGVPTPWGPVGSNIVSRILINVDGHGNATRA